MKLRHFLIPSLLCLSTILTCSANADDSSLGEKSETLVSKVSKSKAPFIKQRLIGLGKTPKISTDGSGYAVAVWIDSHSLMTSHLFNQTTWSKPKVITQSNAEIKNLNLLNNICGQFAVIWLEQNNEGGTTILLSTISKAQPEWATPIALTEEGLTVSNPALAINSSGQMIAAWEENLGAIRVIKYSKYNKKDGWTPASQISSTDRNAFLPAVVLDEQGKGIITWVRSSFDAKPVVEAAVLPRDGSWIPPMDLGSTSFR